MTKVMLLFVVYGKLLTKEDYSTQWLVGVHKSVENPVACIAKYFDYVESLQEFSSRNNLFRHENHSIGIYLSAEYCNQ